VVVKIGGGLLRDGGWEPLRSACQEASEMSRTRPVLVVPGGGPFAEVVRALDGRLSLPDHVAHALALRAMDQLGVLVASLLPDAELLRSLVVPRTLGIVRAAPAFGGRPEIPESWAVTSDSLAVLAAGAIGAREAILLKPVDGVLARWPSADPPLQTLTVDELQALQAGGGGRVLDAYLPEAVRRTGVGVVVRSPEGTGTRITPG
jgi:aspartokinase-like uncharacterized kinase